MPAMKIFWKKDNKVTDAGPPRIDGAFLDEHGMWPHGWFENPREHPRPATRDYKTQIDFQSRLERWRDPRHIQRFRSGHETAPAHQVRPWIKRKPLPPKAAETPRVDCVAKYREEPAACVPTNFATCPASTARIVDEPLRIVSVVGSLRCTTPDLDDSVSDTSTICTSRHSVFDDALAEMPVRKSTATPATDFRPGSAYALIQARRREMRRAR